MWEKWHLLNANVKHILVRLVGNLVIFDSRGPSQNINVQLHFIMLCVTLVLKSDLEELYVNENDTFS